MKRLIVALAIGIFPSIAMADYLDEPKPDRILSFQTRGTANHGRFDRCEELIAQLPAEAQPSESVKDGTTLHLYDMNSGNETGTSEAKADGGAFVACILNATFDPVGKELTADRINFFVLDEGTIAVRNTMHGRVLAVPGMPLMLPGFADGPVIWGSRAFKNLRIGEEGDLDASRQNNRFLGEWGVNGGFLASYNCSFVVKLYYAQD